MKLVATSDFRNPRPDSLTFDGQLHEAHVHKGARFSIGEDLPLEKLSAADRKLVAQLNVEGRIVADSDKEKVALIDKEVAAEKKKAESVKAAEVKK